MFNIFQMFNMLQLLKRVSKRVPIKKLNIAINVKHSNCHIKFKYGPLVNGHQTFYKLIDFEWSISF